MSKVRFVKGFIDSIIKDSTYQDKQTRVNKRMLKFRVVAGQEITICLAFGDIADKVFELPRNHQCSYTFEGYQKEGDDTFIVNYALIGAPATSKTSLKREEEDRKLMAQSMFDKGWRKVAIRVDDGNTTVWRRVEDCIEVDGEWFDRLEFVMDRLGGVLVEKRIKEALKVDVKDITGVAKGFYTDIGLQCDRLIDQMIDEVKTGTTLEYPEEFYEEAIT